MTDDSNRGRRRSQRLTLSVPITVSEPHSNHRVLVERTHTLAVSRYGGLIVLRSSVDPGQSLLMTNRVSRESKQCRVLYLGPHGQDEWQVWIAFLDPVTEFWNITFPAPRSKPLLD